MVKKNILLSLAVVVVGATLLSSQAFANKKTPIPPQVRLLVFVHSSFPQPISLELPCEDSSSIKNWIMNQWQHPGYPFMAPLGPDSARNIDKPFLQFLSEKGLAHYSGPLK